MGNIHSRTSEKIRRRLSRRRSRREHSYTAPSPSPIENINTAVRSKSILHPFTRRSSSATSRELTRRKSDTTGSTTPSPREQYVVNRSSTPSRISVNSGIAETWQPSQPHLARSDARIDQKRRFHAVESSIYPLPADIQEQDRLELQHILYRHGFNDTFLMPIHRQMSTRGLKVLDVGCGPGAWMRDVASSYPRAQVYGVDMAQSLFNGVEVLPNMKFFTGNVLERLPFDDNTFDAVYQRMLIAAIPREKWDHVIKELIRVLKPGGYIELCEPDFWFIRSGPQFSHLWDGVSDVLRKRGVNMRIASQFPRIMTEKGLTIVKDKVASFPLGWGGHHGDLHLVNTQQVFMGLKPFLTKAFQITPEEYDKLVIAAIQECPLYRTYYYAYTVIGRKN
ncbi:hypothetical protein HK098_007188 [Nowakowskiella sp. JEL0407]|nr:hypothetical protein HK098_007188 [Nowakowskiella sp. JEL0407]